MSPCGAGRSSVDRAGDCSNSGFVSLSGMAETIACSIDIGTSIQFRRPSRIATVQREAVRLRYPFADWKVALERSFECEMVHRLRNIFAPGKAQMTPEFVKSIQATRSRQPSIMTALVGDRDTL
jgi:hypothetical protein